MLIAAAFATPGFGQSPVTNGLLARWSGDGNAKDSAGQFDGQVSGGLRYVPGPTGQAFEFNGASAQVDFGSSAGNFGARDFTIACWMNTTSTEGTEAFLSKRVTCDGFNSFWDIRVGGRTNLPGQLMLELENGNNTSYFILASAKPVNDGLWHHIAWVRQSTSSGGITGLIYVDGALDNSTACPQAANLANQSPLVLGRSVCEGFDGTRPYSGAAAELQLFSHALSAEEILTLYQAGKPVK